MTMKHKLSNKGYTIYSDNLSDCFFASSLLTTKHFTFGD